MPALASVVPVGRRASFAVKDVCAGWGGLVLWRSGQVECGAALAVPLGLPACCLFDP